MKRRNIRREEEKMWQDRGLTQEKDYIKVEK